MVSSPSYPRTSKHLSSPGMNNYRLSWHNLYTYLMWWGKDICSPAKQFKFQNCGPASSAQLTRHTTINPAHHAPLPSGTQSGISETAVEQCHISATACTTSRQLVKPSSHRSSPSKYGSIWNVFYHYRRFSLHLHLSAFRKVPASPHLGILKYPSKYTSTW